MKKSTKKDQIPPFKMDRPLRELNGSYYIPVPKAWVVQGLMSKQKLYWIKPSEVFEEEVKENE